MINWLFIRDEIVVHIVTQDTTPTNEDSPESYDTVAQDDSQTFKVGDRFSSELQLQYNKQKWVEKGWLLTDEEIIANNEKRNLARQTLISAGIITSCSPPITL